MQFSPGSCHFLSLTQHFFSTWYSNTERVKPHMWQAKWQTHIQIKQNHIFLNFNLRAFRQVTGRQNQNIKAPNYSTRNNWYFQIHVKTGYLLCCMKMFQTTMYQQDLCNMYGTSVYQCRSHRKLPDRNAVGNSFHWKQQ